MDIRGPGRFLIPPDLTAGVGRGYTPDALDRQPSVGIGRGISKHPGRRGRSPDLRIRGSPPDAEGLAEGGEAARSEEHKFEPPSLMRTQYAGFSLKKQK